MATYTWPVATGSITSYFGSRTAPTAGASTNHQGIDISVPIGTSVMAAMAGTVQEKGYDKARGYYVELDHGNGITSLYQHLITMVSYAVGTSINEGQKIALSGNSGVSTGPHLHFEIQQNDVAVNPLEFKGSTMVNTVDSVLGNVNDKIGDLFSSTDLSGITEVVKKYWYLLAAGMVAISLVKR